MREKSKNIDIILKKSDKLTIKFLDGRILSGEVTKIKSDCAEAKLFQPDEKNNIEIHHLEISTSPYSNSSPALSLAITFSEAAELWNIDSSTLRHKVKS